MTQTRMTTRLPTTLADALTTRAKANHRSVNSELIAILEAAISGTPVTPKPFAHIDTPHYTDTTD